MIIVKGEIRPRDQPVRRRLMRLKIKINTVTTNVAALLLRQRTDDKSERSFGLSTIAPRAKRKALPK